MFYKLQVGTMTSDTFSNSMAKETREKLTQINNITAEDATQTEPDPIMSNNDSESISIQLLAQDNRDKKIVEKLNILGVDIENKVTYNNYSCAKYFHLRSII